MWITVMICGLIIYLLLKLFFYEVDTPLDLASSHSGALFTVSKRLEILYHGSKVYVGLQIPDADSASRQNIDLVFVTKEYLNPYVWFPFLKNTLNKGKLLFRRDICFKVICPNPDFRSLYSGWIKDVLHGGKDKTHDSFYEKLNSVLRTAPISDRLELKGNKYVLGEFIEFKGKEEDIQSLRKIRRSKISQLSVQKITHSTVQVLYAPRDYRVEGSSKASHWEEMTVRSSTEVVFQPQNSTNRTTISCLQSFPCP